MPASRSVFVSLSTLMIAAVAIGAFVTRDQWLPSEQLPQAAAHADEHAATAAPVPNVLKLSKQARQNLGLVSKRLKPQSYWRTVQIPGVIRDRPGRSDRGVSAPAVATVLQIHAFPGDTVKAGDRLFTLRLSSEYLQNTQTELFKATRETALVQEQRARLQEAAKSGVIAEARLIEFDNQVKRQAAAIQAYRQDLLTRGLLPSQIDAVTEGKFVSTIEVVAPPALPEPRELEPVKQVKFTLLADGADAPTYEIQELKVDLGQQVQAGQLLSVLSNHRLLYIEGHAFKQEAPLLENAAQNSWSVGVEFAEDDLNHWPKLDQSFQIHHLANSIDADSRTFDFYVPLENQSHAYEKDGQTFLVWRFRPGQRVKLQVPVEELREVLVLPSNAVVREGPEAFVFRHDGELFTRIAVHVLYEDRSHVVLANDGSVNRGMFLAQSSAATLNRVLKAQTSSGTRLNLHVHADGTVHEAH